MRVLVLTASVALAVGVAAGALAMALLRPSKTAPRFIVPDVQRLSSAGAFHVLQGRGVGPVAVMYRPSSSARAGQVLLQNPPPGTVVSRGARVTLLVASR
jgi:beta-lactam-binding protein with PASTA domain